MLTKLKTIRSHVGLTRFLMECDGDAKPVGYVARVQIADIPSPYAYSPARQVFGWNGKLVVWSEVAHRKYEVFEVPEDFAIFRNYEAAENYNYKATAKGN